MFNSKERYYLVKFIQGESSLNPSVEFRQRLENLLKIQVPENALSVMDYHIDWLYACLNLANDNDFGRVYINNGNIIKAQQEDIDWLIAFKQNEDYHLILIEAKVVTSWDNKQMKSKADRYKVIFGIDGKTWKNVIPYFVCVSPSKPKRLDVTNWPEGMKPNGEINWLKLSKPDGLKKVTRCNESGKKSQAGLCWKIEKR